MSDNTENKPDLEAMQAQLAQAQKAAEEAQSALQKLEANNKALLAEKLEAKKAAEDAALAAAKKSGDVEALEKSWAEKLKQIESEKENQLSGLKSMLDNVTRGATAATIAAELFGQHAELMRPHLDGRLRTEIIDGKPQVRVVDQNGNLSAMTLDDLKNEFKNSARFAPFVVGSRASGGHPAGKAGGGDQTVTRSAFDAMGPIQRAEFMKAGGKVIAG
jgi:multidrug efflux pump subunit AcrA (membrane-fusion protein)